MCPVAPRKPCRASGCRELVSKGSYCGQHERKKEETVKQERIKYDKERGTSASRGYDSRWSKYSKRYRLNNPLCVLCEKEGKLTLAQCVDHIKPVVGGQNDLLFWEPTNHRSLCHNCHSRVTAEQDGGYGNQRKECFI